MRRHTPLCKLIASAVDKTAPAIDPGFACLDLDLAIRGLGRSWRELDVEMLIDVIEAAAHVPGDDDVAVYRHLLMERL